MCSKFADNRRLSGMEDENQLSQQDSDFATRGPGNQLNGDGAGNTNPYAQDVTPDPAR